MAVKITATAENDLAKISHYLQKNFPHFEDSTYLEIKKAILNIVDHPLLGKKLPSNRYKLHMSRLPYYLIYKYKGEDILILRIYHSSRQPLYH